jgi:NCAIR mutase (PurE)-related protein
LELDEILNSLKSGKMTVPNARKLLSLYSLEKIEDFAKIDTGRKYRRGIPEVIFAEQKQLSEIKKIIQRVLKKSNSILVSRLKKNDYNKILEFSKKSKLKTEIGKNSTSILIYKKPLKKNKGKVGILTAGTSDIGVAEEARLMCEAMNCQCISSYDVGVAGLHRVIPVLKEFIKKEVDSIIVVAGMEGALATLVSSSVNVPVIGVPTSVGYGYGEKGIAALASMLQSCSLGLAVVNIDNGIGAGAMAASIANRVNMKRTRH